jgi:metal-responsive CopG/Arc/MetJ family transcriptional regulator
MITDTVHVKTRTRLSVSLSDQLIKEIDRRRGLIKRSTYVEHLIRRGLENCTDKR